MSTLEQTIGNTPLVKLQRMGPNNGSEVWLKLEGNNPAGSVKDRAALSMIVEAEKRGEIKPGDVLIEATSGNTGIALAMIAALKGYRMKLLMPDNMSQERRAAMRAYGAELILVTKEQGMEGARDLALEMANRGEGKLLDQFNNPDNPYAHYTTTGPEIWQQTGGRITHFVSSMGTTGTITGVSRFMREQSKPVTIVGLQPEEGSSIPGIRRWPAEYLPGIFNASLVDEVLDIHQREAENTMRELAVREGIFCGVSSGGAVAGALRVAKANPGAVVVAIICDRGDRYLSTGVFGEEHFSQGAGISDYCAGTVLSVCAISACKKGCAFSSLLPGIFTIYGFPVIDDDEATLSINCSAVSMRLRVLPSFRRRWETASSQVCSSPLRTNIKSFFCANPSSMALIRASSWAVNFA